MLYCLGNSPHAHSTSSSRMEWAALSEGVLHATTVRPRHCNFPQWKHASFYASDTLSRLHTNREHSQVYFKSPPALTLAELVAVQPERVFPPELSGLWLRNGTSASNLLDCLLTLCSSLAPP